MSDRLNGFVVVLARDLRTDDAEATIAAIKQLKGVLDAIPNVANANDAITESRVRHSIGQQLLDVIYPERKS